MEPVVRSDTDTNPPTGSGAIEVQNLKVTFGQKTVLRDVSLSVHPGEIHVILGGSGCGKSTLLRHLIGLREPQGGTVELLGQNLYGGNLNERSQLLRRIGVLFQSGGLFNSLTVRQNVAFPLQEHTDYSREVIERLVLQKVRLVGMEHALDLLPSEISGGMKKRAGLARALALEPELLFFDEPSAGLDPIASSSLDELMVSLRDKMGMTLVVVTHELPSIERIADRVTFLEGGFVLATGPLQEVQKLDHPRVQDFFERRSGQETQAKRNFHLIRRPTEETEEH